MIGVMLLLFGLVEALGIPLLTNPTASLTRLGALAAPLGVALLVADVVLPVPSSLVMVARGAPFGVAVGALLSLVGSLGAGLFGFGLGRRGRAAAPPPRSGGRTGARQRAARPLGRPRRHRDAAGPRPRRDRGDPRRRLADDMAANDPLYPGRRLARLSPSRDRRRDGEGLRLHSLDLRSRPGALGRLLDDRASASARCGMMPAAS